MRIRSASLVVVVAAAAAGLAGCPESCPLESPQVSALPSSCTVLAGSPVGYPVRLCPTCNQTAATCTADLSAASSASHAIYLDTKVEACSGSNSCPPACQANPITCSFTAPTTAGTYTVIAYDGLSGTTVQSELVVITSGAESCSLPVAGI